MASMSTGTADRDNNNTCFLQFEELTEIEIADLCLPFEELVENTSANTIQTAESVVRDAKLNPGTSVDDFISAQAKENTTQATVRDMKNVQRWLYDNKREPILIEHIPPPHLNSFLAELYIGIRKEDGSNYEPTSLEALKNSIERYLKENNYLASLRDRAFSQSMRALTAKKMELKKLGLGNKPNKSMNVSNDEEEKMYSTGALGTNSPKCLQFTVFYNFGKIFGLRSRDEARQLKFGDVTVKTTSRGEKYLEFSERVTKTRDGANLSNTRDTTPKIFATKGARDPVKVYDTFAERRPEYMMSPDSPFYLTPIPEQRLKGTSEEPCVSATAVVVCIAVAITFNKSITSLQSEVKDIESKVNELTEEVDGIKNTLKDIIGGGGGSGGVGGVGGTPAVPDIETKRKLEDVSLKVGYLTSLTSGLPQKLKTVDDTLNELDRVDGKLKTMIPTIEQAKRDLVDVKSDMKTVNINITTLGNSITNVEKSLSSTKQSIDIEVETLTKNIVITKLQTQDASEKVTTLQNNVETSTGILQEGQKKLFDAIAGIANLTKEQQEFLTEKIGYLTSLTSGLPQKLKTIDHTLNELDRVYGELKKYMIPALQEAKGDLLEVKSDMKAVNINIKTLGNSIANVEESLSSTKQSIDIEVETLTKNIVITKLQTQDASEKVTTLQNNVETSTGVLQEGQKKLFDAIAGIANLTKEQQEFLTEKIGYLTSLTSGLPQKLNTIDHTLNELDRVYGELKTMIPTLKEAKRDLEVVQSDMKTVNSDIKALGNNITNVEESLSSTKQSIDSKVQTLSTDLGTTKRQAEDTSEKVTTLQTNVETSTRVLKERQKNLFDAAARILNLTKEQQEFLNEKIAPNTFNKHATTLVILIIIVIVVCEAFAIYILCQGQSKGHGVAQGHGRRDPVNRTRGNADNPGRARKNPILDQIQRDVALERAVCVISLEGTTRALHMDMVRSALGGMAGTARVETRDVHDVLVSSLEDIPAIPAATVNLLCIHFSERHVILEQPHLGLGDKNITTYQAVKQLGGRLAIVYVRDPGSRRLGEQELYNRDIPVQVTAELQELADRDCFFTTYDRLTPFQNTSLCRFISKYLDRR